MSDQNSCGKIVFREDENYESVMFTTRDQNKTEETSKQNGAWQLTKVNILLVLAEC